MPVHEGFDRAPLVIAKGDVVTPHEAAQGRLGVVAKFRHGGRCWGRGVRHAHHGRGGADIADRRHSAQM
ncbi:hypothetical protein [Demequina litorisediminis]|uniref:Uncharacterized protein n=1 Tax=Demequina litorisediminis TaxID=1849022 RepID=A0ABQ6IKH0_9MICO|nr:hypothetical protein [Demequina litorisediminis]GMA37203.1 hypothetical protein GCM10025876_34070 [Demequina litorisediminis]